MKVEIWSDIVCPFCYIGKRKFEKALSEFEGADQIEVEYKSFQLNPDLITDTSKSSYDSLAEHKGIPVEHAKQMSDQVTNMADLNGLTFDFDKAIPANTFNAHRLLHLAKKNGLQKEAKELLLEAYFTNGINIDDKESLLKIGLELGLDAVTLSSVLASDKLSEDVDLDVYEAQQFGIRSVPFFAFDRKYGVSGAQSAEVFLETLEKSFADWKTKQEQDLEVKKGESCDVEGNCD